MILMSFIPAHNHAWNARSREHKRLKDIKDRSTIEGLAKLYRAGRIHIDELDPLMIDDITLWLIINKPEKKIK